MHGVARLAFASRGLEVGTFLTSMLRATGSAFRVPSRGAARRGAFAYVGVHSEREACSELLCGEMWIVAAGRASHGARGPGACELPITVRTCPFVRIHEKDGSTTSAAYAHVQGYEQCT